MADAETRDLLRAIRSSPHDLSLVARMEAHLIRRSGPWNGPIARRFEDQEDVFYNINGGPLDEIRAKGTGRVVGIFETYSYLVTAQEKIHPSLYIVMLDRKAEDWKWSTMMFMPGQLRPID